MSQQQFNGPLPGPCGLPPGSGGNTNRTSPSSSSSSTNGASYVVLSPSMGNSYSNHDFSYENPLGGQSIQSASGTDGSIEQALVKVEELARENQELRETLKDNNEMMKRQFNNLAQWKQRVKECNAQNLKKFEEQKQHLLDLQRQNQELRQQINQGSVSELLKAEAKQAKEDNAIKSREIVELQRRIEELTSLVQAGHDDSFHNTETVFVSRSMEDPVKIEELVEERDGLQTRIIQLEAQVRLFREQNDQLMQDMEKLQRLKEQIQTENSNLNEENNKLQKRLLSDMQQRKHLSGDSIKQYDYSMVDMSEEPNTKKQTAEVQTSARQDLEILEMQTTAADRCESFSQTEEKNDNTFSMSDITTDLRAKLQFEREQVSGLKSKLTSQNTQLAKYQAEIGQKTQMLEHYKQQLDMQVARVTEENRQQTQELMQQLDTLQRELQQTKSEQFSSHSGDIQSLKSQVLTLINEVHESSAKLDAATKALDKKSVRVAELEQKLYFQTQVMQQSRSEADMLIESLRGSITNYEDTIRREQTEHATTKKQHLELRGSFNQLVNDYKELLDTYDQYKAQPQQGQNPQTMEEISRLTAQIIAAEEAITYRDEQIKEVKEENVRLKDEIETTVPVLKAQADIWKQDFDAERDARERQHAEKERILLDMKNLEVQNQQLLDELEHYSRKSLAEMQQRHAPGGATYQQQLQNHLHVDNQHQHQPHQPVGDRGVGRGYQYPQHQGNNEIANQGAGMGQQPPSLNQPNSRASAGSQDEGEQQMSCPKCGLPCPDLDTLQIHVLECLE